MNHLSARPRTRAAVSSKSSSFRAVGANVTDGAGVGGTDGSPVGLGDTDGGGETVGAAVHQPGIWGAAPTQLQVGSVQVGSAGSPEEMSTVDVRHCLPEPQSVPSRG